ncbi:MAG: hypothetical protein RR033_00645 [Clostridia bacterium]
MDFKSYVKGKKSDASARKNDAPPEFKKTVEETIDSHKGKSQEELMSEIIARAKKERSEGKLSNDDLDNFYQQVAPMLSKEQVARLKSIMKMLK